MTIPMSVKTLAATDSRDLASDLAYTVDCIIMTARLALDADNRHLNPPEAGNAAIEKTLEVASLLMGIVIDGAEMLERDCSRGPLVQKSDAA